VRIWRGPKRLPGRNLFGFITIGLKFVFLAQVGPMQRGIPTAFAAPMLTGLLISSGTYN
jgi:hypothetical protein